ncbi:CSN12 [Candida jiufengensis]|uniref:CSN12 n=1 Tax=Candida jiufengensis TaxID=497108 RepID=UPI0022247C21|nr:CSN12 [Candida jiufengensis]KAI5956289.1 CSN12 [Candida jiufengensis]
MSTLDAFIHDFKTSISKKDSKLLKSLITINPGQIAQVRKNFNVPTVYQMYSIPDKFRLVLTTYLKILKSIYIQQSLNSSFDNFNEMCNYLLKASESCDNWIMPVIISSFEELILLYKVKQSKEPEDLDSILDDTIDDNNNLIFNNEKSKKSSLEELISTLRKGFILTFNDKNPDLKQSKKNDVYFFLSNFVKYCFKMNKLVIAKSMMEVVKNSTQKLPSMNQSISTRKHGITYLYFQSLIALDDGDYLLSEKLLDDALKLLSYYKIKDSKQLQQILIILIPLKLYNKGKLPNNSIWIKFKPLKILYKDNFLKAIQEGNLKKYDECLKKFEILLLKKHLYILMLLLRQFVQLKLIKKITNIIKDNNSNDSMIQLNAFKIGFEISSNYNELTNTINEPINKINILEIENIIANLISIGLIRGQLSNNSNVIILSKSKPFPKIFDVKVDKLDAKLDK